MNDLEWLRRWGAGLPRPEYRDIAEVAYMQHTALMERHHYLHSPKEPCLDDSSTCRAIAALADFRKRHGG